MNKKRIIKKILSYLSTELTSTELAAHNAHLAAIDDQSIAETQYDTVAIEAGYLAEGQSKRVDEIKNSIALFEQLKLRELPLLNSINIGSLIQLENKINTNEWLFIAPAAGGFKCTMEESKITVITPHSPMGQALMNKEVDEEVSLTIQGMNKEVDYISKIT